MKLSKDKLKKILVVPGYISEKEFEDYALKAQEQEIAIEAAIMDSEAIEDGQLGQLVAQEFGFAFVNLRNEKINESALKIIPEDTARLKQAVVFGKDDQAIKLAMSDPGDIEIKNMAEKKAGCPAQVFYATEKDILEAMRYYKTDYQEMLAALSEKIKNRKGSIRNDDSVVEFLNKLLEYAVFSQASDVHLEPLRKKAMVRFRVDGQMKKIIDLPKEVMSPVIARIKIMARIKTDEHRAALDGKYRFEFSARAIDVRVSIIPLINGENAVLRLLAEQKKGFGISNLGFSEKHLKIVKKAINRPHGMILTTGPTGSGKTTTLYEILKLLNKPEVHIATIEDPVEYDVEGISQIQVNLNTNLTFAKGLRAIVRQDPDIIMVGEIRDEETAAIAVNSAMTGHLVLSTLHTNDAATAIPRMLDLNIEPFLLASTLEIVIAQRLVRKICEKCRASYFLSKDENELLDVDPVLRDILRARNKNLGKITLFKGTGCRICANTGFRGRIGIFEALEINSEIRDLIAAKASSDQIATQAKKSGMSTIFEDGISKVFSGLTTLAEISRAAREE